MLRGDILKRKISSFEKKRSRTGYIFLSPWIFGSVFILIYPVIFSLILSFGDIKSYITYSVNFVGISNYKEIFIADEKFVPYLLTTIIDMLINTPMIIIFSLIIAIMVNKDIKGKAVFRTIFFLPVLLGAGYIMQQVLGQDVQGNSTELARSVLLPPNVQNYIGQTAVEYITEFFNRITVVMWKSGVQIVLFLSGLQSISPAIYEASRIDGAGEWEIFWKITLPMVTPILLLNFVYTIISAAFEENSLLNYIISIGFKKNEFEVSSAMGWIYFAVVLVFLGIIFLILNPFIKRLNGTD